MKKAILLIIDGLGDLPTPKTPLQAAKKPNFDKLAKAGISGLVSTISPFVVPGSDTAHLSLLGYSPKTHYHGRGPLEALGLGMELLPGDVAFRANFATATGNEIVDRRAGRIDTTTASALARYLSTTIGGVQVIFRNSVEHRGVLILRGPALDPRISEVDPHDSNSLQPCVALVQQAQQTANIVNQFILFAREKLAAAPENLNRKLPANMVLLRGAGQFHDAPSFSETYGLSSACVAGGALYKGIARYLGMRVIDVPGATGDKNTDLASKGRATADALKDHDFVFLHVKACDSAGHDGDFAGKKKMIERIDKELLPLLVKTGAYLLITGDHSTPCSRKAHSGDEVPILVYGADERTDSVKKFDEISVMKGGLGHLEGKDVVPLILNLLEKSKKYGS